MADLADYQEMKDVLKYTWQAWQAWMREAKKDLEYCLGMQWTSADTKYLTDQKRQPLTLNKIRRFIALLTGYQRQNRLAITYEPWEGSDALAAQQLTHLMSKSLGAGGQTQFSQAFKPAVTVGLDWVNLLVDFNDDWESGDIRFKRTAWTRMLPEPTFQELDLSDASYLFRTEKLLASQLKLMVPGVKPTDFKPSATGSENSIILDPGHGLEALGIGHRYDLVEYWKRETESRTFLLDTETGTSKLFETKGKYADERLRYILQTYPQLKLIKKNQKVVSMELYIGDDQVWKGLDPIGCGDFPYIPLFCYYTPEYDKMHMKLTGVVRGLRDPQNELNKRRSQLLHALNTLVLSGWKYEENALVDEDQIDQASGAGVKLRIKEGKMDVVREIQERKMPLGIVKLEEMFANDLQDISGINAELMATIEKNMPGIAIQLRQRQSLIAIQEIFDNRRLSKIHMGRLYLKAVQHNYTRKKIERILNQQMSPQLLDPDFGKYDCTVTEDIESTTQKQYNFQKLVWFNQNVAPVHPLIMVKAADMPEEYREAQVQFMLSQLGQPPPKGDGSQPPGPGGEGGVGSRAGGRGRQARIVPSGEGI